MENARDLILEDALKVAIEETKKRQTYEKVVSVLIGVIVFLVGVILCNF